MDGFLFSDAENAKLKRSNYTGSLIPTPIRLAGWLLVLISILLLIVFPMLTSYMAGQPKGIPMNLLSMLKYVEIAQKWLLRFFTVLWVFFLGGCFASFLNVVAWRLPRGRGILGSSKCPNCDTKLSFAANMPIFGWLNSGGQCRTCRQPISPRYLWVEVILGLIFVLVVAIELFCGGVNLPIRSVDAAWGIERLVFSPRLPLIHTVIFHLTLVCLIFVFALVRFERKKIPNSIFIFGLVAGFGFSLCWPWVQQASWPKPVWPMEVSDTLFTLSLSSGLLSGLLAGGLIALSYRKRQPLAQEVFLESVFSMTLIGLFLGMTFVLAVTLAFLVLDGALLVVGDFRSRLLWTSPVFKIGTLVLIGLLTWRFTSFFGFWPGPYSNEIELTISIAGCFLLSLLISAISFPASLKPLS